MAANFTETELLEFRLRLSRMMVEDKELNRPKLKEQKYGIMSNGIEGAPLFSDLDLNNQKMSSGQDVFIEYIERIPQGTATTRGVSADFEGTTRKMPVTLSGVREEFKISDLMHRNNDWKYSDHLDNTISQKLRNIRERIESECAVQLEALRSQVTTFDNGSMVWSGAPDYRFTQALSEQDKVFQNLSQMAMENDLDSALRVVGSGGAGEVFNFLGNQGEGNAQNLNYNASIVDNFMYSPAVANTDKYTAYAFRRGAFGLYFWNNMLHQMGRSNGYQVWTQLSDPMFGFNIELYLEDGREDTTGAGVVGGEVDYTQTLVMYVDFKLLGAPDNNTDIYKWSQLAV